jgi:hypothetical protein
MGDGTMSSSIWTLKGQINYRDLNKDQRDEFDKILSEMRSVFMITRDYKIRQVLERYGEPGPYTIIYEFDLKDYAGITQEYCRIYKCEVADLIASSNQIKEEMDVSLSHIKGIFANAKIWRGHVDMLRSFQHQIERGVPLSERQKDALGKILSRYSKQIVTNNIL